VNRRGGLGKGLAALIPGGDGGAQGNARAWLAELPIGAIEPNPRQPRDVFDDDELDGLAASIEDVGLLQPVVVRQSGDGTYELIAGERRLRASKRAGLEVIPAVVRQTGDSDLLKEALIENIHRVQLNPLEEAAAYQQLLEDFDFTQEELASKLGKSRPAISNTLRLLQLPVGVQRRVAAGVISAGHAKALLALADDTERMDRLATRVVAEGMSVRALEETIRLTLLEPATGRDRVRGRSSSASAPGLVELQHDLSDALQVRVRITMGARKGKLQVEFGSVDELERIVGVIARGLEDAGPAPSAPPGASPAAAPTDLEPAAGPAVPDPPAPREHPDADLDLPPDDVLPTGSAAVDLPAPPTWDVDAIDTEAAAGGDTSRGDADAATAAHDPTGPEAARDLADLDDDELDPLTRPE
jgi:ParB family transcriptional regulator, chromosome partitioning protein